MFATVNLLTREGFNMKNIIIDLHLGGLTPVEAVKPVLKYLKHRFSQ